MTLNNLYKEFLASPNTSFLTENVSLHYVTTLSSTYGSSAVINQLKSTEYKVLSQEFIDVVEGGMVLAVIVDTKIEFVDGGGPYLPKLDDNFIADRTVNLPITHFVSFSGEMKIRQIRLNWDQGSLLKLIDIIGKTGRNWPIHDGMDQIKLIASSVESVGGMKAALNPQSHENVNGEEGRVNIINPVRDPHASLCLFTPRDKHMHDKPQTVIATRSSAKPAPRDFQELFGDLNLEPDSPTKSPVFPRDRSKKPGNPEAIAKNFGPSRLFDVEDNPNFAPEKITNPAKFKHFEFSQGAPNEEMKSPRMPVKPKKHESHWSFDDFVTPEKSIPSRTLRSNDVRHWGTSDDEVMDSPERVKKVDKPRKNVQAHFDFPEDGSHEEKYAPVIGRCRGQGNNNGLGLYKDLFDDLEESKVKAQKPNLHSLANVKDRRKDFEAHFIMSDKSPGITPTERISQDKAKAVKMMDSNWSSYDHSPTQKENASGFPFPSRNGGSGRPLTESTNILSKRIDVNHGIKTDGDGMGGRKGTGRAWDMGDNNEGQHENEIKNTKYRTSHQMGKVQASGGDFWDF